MRAQTLSRDDGGFDRRKGEMTKGPNSSSVGRISHLAVTADLALIFTSGRSLLPSTNKREGAAQNRRNRVQWRAPIFSLSLFCVLTVLSGLMIGQTPSTIEPEQHSDCPGSILPGAVIEKFEDEFSSTKAAGMLEGDLALSWSRGETRGVLDSPFALSALAVDQIPLGNVVVEGRRGGEKKTWTLRKRYWGTLTRPNFCGVALNEYQKAIKLIDDGNPVEASKVLLAAAERKESLQPAWLRPWLLFRAATALAHAQQWKEADEAFQQATSLAGDNILVSGQIFDAWGNTYFERNDWKNSIDRLQQAIALDKQAGRTAAVGDSTSTLTLVFHASGDIIRAEETARQTVKIWQEFAPGGMDVGSAYINLGAMLEERDDLVAAEDSYRKALTSYQGSAAHTVGAAYILNNLGEIARSHGDFKAARDYLEQAIAILQVVDPGTRSTAEVLTNLASVAEGSTTGRQPEDYLREALTITNKVSPDGSPEEADIQNALGKMAVRHGEPVSAEQHFLRALALNDKFAPQGTKMAETLDNLGDLYLAGNDLDGAEAFYHRAAAIQELIIPGTLPHAESLAGLAGVAERRNQTATAASYYERAVAALESQAAHLGGGSDVRAEFRGKHEQYYRNYISVLTAQGQTVHAFDVSEGSRARTLFETLSSARIDISKGADVGLLERQRQLGGLIKAKSAHRIEVLGGKHTEEELKTIEEEISKLNTEYRSLEELIRANSPAYAALTQPQPLTAKEIQTQLLDKDTILLEYSLGEDRSHVFALTPDSLEAFEIPKRADIEKQARLVYQLLTDRNRPVKGETEAQHNKRWAESAKAYDTAATELSRMVLAPVAAQMKNKRLVIVADGALHYVPFGALPEPSATNEHTSEPAQPLTVNHEIVSLPSASVLALLRQQYKDRKQAPNAVAVLADPVFAKNDPRVSGHLSEITSNAGTRGPANTGAGKTSEGRQPQTTKTSATVSHKHSSPQKSPAKPNDLDAVLSVPLSASLLTRSAVDLGLDRNGQLALPRLRFTREEADAIYAVTPHAKALEATDFQATRATAISPDLANYRIVHFATHGLLNSQHPELSGLVFSLVDKNGKSQDGFLTLQDIYNLNLNADLVVLSACETGLGKEISGEGLIGLTRGFMYAGASRVVASLWNVSDVATARLMAEFYRAMEKDGLPPAAALRAAQIKMLEQKRWASPYYWAAFQLQGDWK